MSRGHFADDITGKRFGMLTVMGKAPNYVMEYKGKARPRSMWYCQCDCGSPVKVIRGSHLKSGAIQSCGCLGRGNSIKAKTKHGQSKSRLYTVWLDMKNRCQNPNVPCYKNYGGRGISVCEEWASDFSSFSAWAYSSGYDEHAKYGDCTLERIDTNKDYSPDNCKWADSIEQSNNRRNNHVVCYKGKKYTIAELAKELGINEGTIRSRIRNGWSMDDLGLPPSKTYYRNRI